MDYLLTGSTGLLGRHILFELLRDIVDHEQDSSIYLIVRPNGSQSTTDRIIDVLTNENAPEFIRQYNLDDLLSRIIIIDCDLSSKGSGLDFDAIDSDKLIAIHNAASTNLASNSAIEEEILANNYNATKFLIRNVDPVKVKRFVFVSTAFSRGIQPDCNVILPDHRNLCKGRFRNAYEKYKSITEDFLLEYCSDKQIELQILRPSIICGRLLEKPLYRTTKFDGFYGWAKFFFRVKDQINSDAFRILVNSEGTLNTVPVDFVAKVVCKAVHEDDIKFLNIVNPLPPLHENLISIIFEKLGLKAPSFVEEMPSDLSRMENLYYKGAAKVFNPYIATDNQIFECSKLVEKYYDFHFGDILDHFENLIDYAISKDFEAA